MGLQHLMEIKSKFIEFKIEGENYKAKELTCDEFKEYQKALYEFKDGKKVIHAENAQDALIYAALYDNEDKKVFEKKDKALIGKLPQHIVNIIWEQVTEANGMNDDKVKN